MKLINFLFFFFILARLTFALELKSSSFRQNEFIPPKFTCEGDNVSPSLVWGDIPAGTESFALICDDPDAPFKTWVHWVIYDIPKEIGELKEGIPAQEILDFGAKQGINDFGNIGYGGPCPPPGKPHRYFFKLFALKKKLNLPPGLNKDKLLRAIKEDILGEAELVGKYRR
ncbi:MAG: YbhB/YbcL family Raf kinase inhibitor-like protein [Candidatus Omnitrophica bacterium]|nr:YbhB/YbcL family Raf kinase inhibitor-like protein [Candidatus Omnitrophota bacterium]MCM8798715.1 YbhB/YbcL family Raf kinase inhibitor-like protein [Candidatus Omnitrophota bacterium]